MIKNGFCEIQVNGKTIGLRFNMYAIELFNEVKGINTTTKNLTTIVYAGMLANCFVKQTEPEFSFEDIADWVELQMITGDENKHLQIVSECFAESEVLKATAARATNGAADDDTKKKIAAVLT